MHDTIVSFGDYAFFFPAQAKQLALAALVGLLLGVEREFRGKVASLRTFSAICVGSCLFTLLSVHGSGAPGEHAFDSTRIAAQIVSGIGFLGAGVIFKTANRIEGITTAALIWLSAGFGMACGFNRIYLVIWALIVGIVFHLSIFILYKIIYLSRKPSPPLETGA